MAVERYPRVFGMVSQTGKLAMPTLMPVRHPLQLTERRTAPACYASKQG